MLRLLHERPAISPCCHGNVMKWRNYTTWTSSKGCIFRKFPQLLESSCNFCKFPQFHCITLHKYAAYFIAFFKKTCPIIKDFCPQQSQKKTQHLSGVTGKCHTPYPTWHQGVRACVCSHACCEAACVRCSSENQWIIKSIDNQAKTEQAEKSGDQDEHLIYFSPS